MDSTTTPLTPDQQKAMAAHKAVEFIQEGQLIGLGTGSTIRYFLEALGKRIRSEGLNIRGIPTSQATAKFANTLGIPLLDNDTPWDIEVAVDGADQVDPQLNLIKGGGGALMREKIVARAARKFIVIVDQAKHREQLGLPFPLPVEIAVFGWTTTKCHLENLGWPSTLRQQEGRPCITDNGNYILDLKIPNITNPHEVEAKLRSIPGVMECGLFVGMTSLVITGTDQGLKLAYATDSASPSHLPNKSP